jgi:hypothetical protein
LGQIRSSIYSDVLFGEERPGLFSSQELQSAGVELNLPAYGQEPWQFDNDGMRPPEARKEENLLNRTVSVFPFSHRQALRRLV